MPVPVIYVCAVTALLLWSGTAIANKIAVLYMDGLTAGVLRSMLAGFFALGIIGIFKLPFPKPGRGRGLLTISGLCSFAIWPSLMSIGIEYTTVSHAALIMAMIPLFTVFITSTIDRTIPAPGWWMGALLALLATSMLIVGHNSIEIMLEDGSSLKGDLLVLSGCIVCSAGYVAGGKLSPVIGTAATTFWGLSLALVFLVPVFVVIHGQTTWGNVGLDGWMAIMWMTLLSSLLGYALWFYALGGGGIARIASLQLLMPVITLIAAAFVLGEHITVFLTLMCTAVIVGTVIAHRSLK